MPKIQAIAVSAPHWPGYGSKDNELHLNSDSPFSLLNAMRCAAAASSRQSSAWFSSNWSDSETRWESIFISDYWTETNEWLLKILKTTSPNLVFIGAMSISFKGALEVAKLVRKMCPSALVILGGKHMNECSSSFWGKNVKVSDNSPVSCQLDGRIPDLFDFFVSGEAEYLVESFGEAFASLEPYLSRKTLKLKMVDALDSMREEIKGSWIVFSIISNSIKIVSASSKKDDMLDVSQVYNSFPLGTGFDVLHREFTAHAYSYMSLGCAYSCFFCSENMTVNGPVDHSEAAVLRLVEQFELIKKLNPNNASIFIEDSILLSGSIKLLGRFYEHLHKLENTIPFGAQFTTDLFLSDGRIKLLEKLVEVGLKYLFIGIETLDEDIAAQMSKNNRGLGKKGTAIEDSWSSRQVAMIQLAKSLGIDLGFSVLFGLGESHSQRLKLIANLHKWMIEYQQPVKVSLNWAVKHPLSKLEADIPDYLDWAISPNSEKLVLATQLFGEASEIYGIDGRLLPTLIELKDMEKKFRELPN